MTSQKYSVATLVIIALVTATILLLGAFGISYYAYDRNRQLALLHHELAVNADRLATGLAAPVWNYDDIQVDTIIESSLMDKNIYGVVANASGKIHVRLRDAQWRMVVGDREFPASGLVVAEREITFANKPIGTVKVFASRKFTEERLRKTLILIISIILIADLIMIFSLYLLIWHIMLKPLKVIERYAVTFSAGGGEGATIEGSGFHGELDRLRASIEKMVGLLDARYAEIQASAKELRGTREKLEAILQSSPLSILTIDPAGRILSWNKGAEIMFGWTEEEAVSRICPTVPESGIEDYGQMVARGLRGESFAGYVRHRQKKDNSLVEANIACAPLISGTGATVGIVAILEDITERKQTEDELKKHREHLEELVSERTASLTAKTDELKESQSALVNIAEDLQRKSDELAIARERAEAADRLKSAFLATMSHELRTPLNSIIGFTGILLQGLAGALNKEQKKQLKMVQDSAHHLLALINDVLDISKIEAGQVEIVAKRFDMPALIQKIIENLTPLAEKKGVGLTVRIAPDVGAVVSDRRRVEQIIINLLGNAVKFTGQGEVRLECAIEGGEEDDWMVTRVTDTGAGMKREDMDVIFKPFQQIDSGITRQYEGTGLGLSICKRLVELLGGKIWAESEWGKGSAFAFTLPLQKE